MKFEILEDFWTISSQIRTKIQILEVFCSANWANETFRKITYKFQVLSRRSICNYSTLKLKTYALFR